MTRTRKVLVFLIILVIAIVAVGFVISFAALIDQPQSISSPKPTPISTPTSKTGNVTVSGLIIVHGLTIPPTEVQFINGETQQVYKAAINPANHSYIITLPNNQSYGIEGDWNGRTFNATGIPMGAITMQCDNGSPVLNLYNVNGSIVQNLVVGK